MASSSSHVNFPKPNDRWSLSFGLASFDIAKRLPAVVIQAFDAIGDIPLYLNTLDLEANDLLQMTIDDLTNLQDLYLKKHHYNFPELLQKIQATLTLIVKHEKPVEIFYPHILAAFQKAKETKGHGGVPEEQHAALREAEEKARALQEEALQLLNLFNTYEQPAALKPSDASLFGAIDALLKDFEQVAKDQMGLLNKVHEYVVSLFKKYWSEWDKQKEKLLSTPSETGQHPLMRLKSLIDKYQKEVEFKDIVEEEISNILLQLEVDSPVFKGILKEFSQRKALYSDLMKLARKSPADRGYKDKLLAFWMKHHQSIPGAPANESSTKEKEDWVLLYLKSLDLRNQDPIYKDVIYLSDSKEDNDFYEFWQNHHNEILGAPKDDTDYERTISWAKEYVRASLAPSERKEGYHAYLNQLFIDTTTFIARHLKEAPSDEVFDTSLLDFWVDTHESIDGAPDRNANDVDKKAWALRYVASYHPNEINREIKRPFLKIYKGWYRREMCLLFANLNKHEGKGLQNLTNNFSLGNEKHRELAHALWDVISCFDEVNECHRLTSQIDKEERQDMSALVKKVDKAIMILEKQYHLRNLTADKDIFTGIQDQIFDWTSKIRAGLIRNESDSSRTNELRDNFKKIKKLYLEGQFLKALNLLKMLILENTPLQRNIWAEKEAHSPLTLLKDTLSAFREAPIPHKLPKSAKEVLQDLSETHVDINEDSPWNPGFLDMAIDEQVKQLIENSLGFSGFHFAHWFIGLPKGDRQKDFQHFIQAMQTLAGQKQDFDFTDEVLIRQIEKLVGRSLKFEKGEDTHLLKNVRAVIDEKKKHYPPHNLENQKILRDALYFSLLSVIIEDKSHNWVSESFAKIGTSILCFILELFIRPFSNTFIDTFRNHVVLEAKGKLTEEHLIPVDALSGGFGTFNQAMKDWPKELEKPEKERIKGIDGGSRDHNLNILLQQKKYSKEFTRSQIAQKSSSYMTGRYLNIANMCHTLDALITNINENARADVLEKGMINSILVFCKKLLSVIPWVYVQLAIVLIRTLEFFLNLTAQMLVKYTVWQFSLVNKLIKGMLSALFSTEKPPIADILIYEQLLEVRKEFEKEKVGVPEKLDSKEDHIKAKLKSFFLFLLEVLEYNNYHTPSQISSKDNTSTVAEGKKFLLNQLTDVLASAVMTTSKSFLNKDQLNEMLYRLLKIANGVLQGEEAVLTLRQKEDLVRKLREIPPDREIQKSDIDRLTSEEIAKEVKERQSKASEEIPILLEEIQNQGIIPAVDQAIDNFQIAPSSEGFLKYMNWMEKRLFSFTGDEVAKKDSLISNLEAKLGSFDASNRESVRDLHSYYNVFIAQFTAHQAFIDNYKPIHYHPLNTIINQHITDPLKELTTALTGLIASGEGKDKCEEKLKEFKKALLQAKVPILRIKEAENNVLNGMKNPALAIGMRVFSTVKEEALKPLARAIVKNRVNDVTKKARGLAANPQLVEHIIYWQLLGFLRV